MNPPNPPAGAALIELRRLTAAAVELRDVLTITIVAVTVLADEIERGRSTVDLVLAWNHRSTF